MIRTLSCLFVFGVGSEALAGSGIAVFACGALALYINHLWRRRNVTRSSSAASRRSKPRSARA